MVYVAGSTISLWQGDISDLKVDAVVNAANNHLWMGAGVAGALKRRGGACIEEEALVQGPLTVGEAVITTAGTLPAGHVIHAAVMGQDLKTDLAKVREATHNSLSLLVKEGLTSIALPAFGTGVGGVSVPNVALVMVDESTAFLGNCQAKIDVTFALFDTIAYDAFEIALSQRS